MKDLIRFLKYEIYGTWRYRWIAMIVAWSFCLIGWMAVYSLPDIYEARTRVYVDAQSRLASVMARVGAAPATASRVFMVRQALLAREKLEKVARVTGLDIGAETVEDMDLLLFELGDNIGISTGRSSEARNLYSISYASSDRNMAVSVVQALLDIFVQDVLEMKEEGSDVVAGYLEDQMAHYSKLLSDSEIRLAEFKKEYVGLLPGDSGGIFERLQEQMNLRSDYAVQLQIEIDKREELRRQLGGEAPNLPDDASGAFGVSVPGSSVEISIQNNERRRAELLLLYTDRHPDIVAIDEQLAQLYLQRETDRAALAVVDGGIEGVQNATNPVYQSVQIALNESGVLVAGFSSNLAQADQSIARLQEQVNTIPRIEAEFAQLTRNYDQYRGLYSELLVQKERARLGTVGAERDVVNFNIIEPPAAEAEPIAPRRTLLLVMVLVFGLGLGIGIAFVVHLLNPVFLDAETLRKATGYPVLGAVSLTWLERDKVTRAVKKAAFLLTVTALITAFVLTVALQDAGVEMLQNLYASSAG